MQQNLGGHGKRSGLHEEGYDKVARQNGRCVVNRLAMVGIKSIQSPHSDSFMFDRSRSALAMPIQD